MNIPEEMKDLETETHRFYKIDGEIYPAVKNRPNAGLDEVWIFISVLMVIATILRFMFSGGI